MKNIKDIRWSAVWPWLLLIAAAYFLAKKIAG
jgi:hypothetical protein